MSPTVTAIFQAARALSVTEQRELIDCLEDALNGEPPLSKEEWLDAWGPELDRRREAYLSGKEPAIDVRDALAQLRKELG
jgi:hypothetical protein